jgi:hypothetical protein
MMRITANFVVAPRYLASIVAGLGCVIALVASGAIWLAADWWVLREEVSDLEKQVIQLESRRAEMQQTTTLTPASAELSALLAKVVSINKMSVIRGWGTADMLQWLEENMPKDVHLVAVHHKARDGEVLLVAEAANAAALTKFLSLLEREKHFAEVLLSKQITRASGIERAVQFEIKVTLQP